MPLSNDIWPQPKFPALLLWKMLVEGAIDQTEQADDDQGQNDEIRGQDGVGDKRVERLVRKVIGIIQRIAALLPSGKAREENQRGRVKQKDRLVRIGRPCQAQHGGPDDTREAGLAG